MEFSAGEPPFVGDPEIQRVLGVIWERFYELEVIGVTLNLPEIFAPPDKALEGDVVFADGTTWNPGSGRGIYRFDGSVWEKI